MPRPSSTISNSLLAVRPAGSAAGSGPRSGEAGSQAAIRIGPAGWSYPDWAGYVYPSRRTKGFHEATYLAEFFDTIEINTSFYNPIRPDHAALWIERVAANPRFVFTAKLWQRFTHAPLADTSFSGAAGFAPVASSEGGPARSEAERSDSAGSPRSGGSGSAGSRLRSGLRSEVVASREADEKAVRAGFDVLRAKGKLGAVLLQFPFSFHRTPETAAQLATLLKRFGEYPLVVEVRHASWQVPETFSLLAECNAGFCNIDQPVIGRSLEPSAKVTSSIGYVRLHGRRYDTWFTDDPEVPSHERYNYLYTTKELAPWAARVAKVAKRAREVFVITNNHYQGKGVVNALELISMLKGSKVKVPEPLRQKFSELEAIADGPGEAPSLFPLDRK